MINVFKINVFDYSVVTGRVVHNFERGGRVKYAEACKFCS